MTGPFRHRLRRRPGSRCPHVLRVIMIVRLQAVVEVGVGTHGGV
jgi:hypothetical protein